MDEVDSGAATHVRPLWFGNSFPPQLRTVTDDNIQLHGYRWIYTQNVQGRPVVIPFYVCDVQQPILSVTRLAEQGFHINFKDNPTITHSQGFASSLKQKDGLYFLPTRVAPLPDNMVLSIQQTSDGAKATISPVTLTPTGVETMCGGNTDLWTYNNDTQTSVQSTFHTRCQHLSGTPGPLGELQTNNTTQR